MLSQAHFDMTVSAPTTEVGHVDLPICHSSLKFGVQFFASGGCKCVKHAGRGRQGPGLLRVYMFACTRGPV